MRALGVITAISRGLSDSQAPAASTLAGLLKKRETHILEWVKFALDNRVYISGVAGAMLTLFEFGHGWHENIGDSYSGDNCPYGVIAHYLIQPTLVFQSTFLVGMRF